ncbi:hypothetical protein DPMN_104373 [Dreissena polymorpha]|uniref:Uncharacterized protein n=1 Tax=Dreissena polymorpha TaxID=45954 RepID=A0A9D4K131_DREPO|nr:hypothetical protein DPMN_104373 [Dreissena polymorpha]
MSPPPLCLLPLCAPPMRPGSGRVPQPGDAPQLPVGTHTTGPTGAHSSSSVNIVSEKLTMSS